MGAWHQFGAESGVPSTNNIQRFREDRGWSRPQLGKRMGTSGQQVERLEKAQRRLTQGWIDKAAAAFNVAPEDIISPQGERSKPPAAVPMPAATDDDTVELIALDLSLSMGPGTLIEDFVEEDRVRMSLRFIQQITRTPSDRLRLVRGIGDSMEPTLRTGDRVMVDINDRQLSRTHGVYWIDHLGTHGIKRLRPAGRGTIMVMSDNPMVPDFEVDAQDIRIEGRVIWFARDL